MRWLVLWDIIAIGWFVVEGVVPFFFFFFFASSSLLLPFLITYFLRRPRLNLLCLTLWVFICSMCFYCMTAGWVNGFFLISFLSINRLIGLTRAEMRIKWWGELVW